MPTGDIVPIDIVWELSKLWYHNRLDPDFSGRSVAQVHQIFEKAGLPGPFWRFS